MEPTAAATRAREALRLASRAVDLVVDGPPKGEDWLIGWVAAMTLLRSVGHVLNRIDVQNDKRLRDAVQSKWEQMNATKPEPRIFWHFIEEERNLILKEFAPRVRESGVGIRRSGDRIEEIWRTYESTVPGFPGRRHSDLLREAVRFWESYLDEVEAEANTGR